MVEAYRQLFWMLTFILSVLAREEKSGRAGFGNLSQFMFKNADKRRKSFSIVMLGIPQSLNHAYLICWESVLSYH